MYVIIAGGGRTGLNLAKSLSQHKHDVVIIEEDEKRCEELSAGMDALVLCGNCTETKTLNDAGLAEADVFVSVTGTDETNLFACLLAKNEGVPRVIARIANPENETVFNKLGVDTVINPEMAAAAYIEKLIIRPGVIDLTIIGRGDAEILELKVPEGAKIANMPIKEIQPEDYLIVAIYKNNEIVIPKGESVIHPRDRVLVLAKVDAIPKVEELFKTELSEK